MPAALDQGSPIRLCGSGLPAGILAPGGATHHDHHGPQDDHHDALEIAGVVSYDTSAWIATGNPIYEKPEHKSAD